MDQAFASLGLLDRSIRLHHLLVPRATKYGRHPASKASLSDLTRLLGMAITLYEPVRGHYSGSVAINV